MNDALRNLLATIIVLGGVFYGLYWLVTRVTVILSQAVSIPV